MLDFATTADYAYEAPVLFVPQIVETDPRQVETDWAVFGAVAGALNVGVGFVAYVCSVCSARSFWSCASAVRRWFSRSGC